MRGNVRQGLGRPFTKASLRLLLTNATYAGNVNHRGTLYAGEQPAIVEPTVWEEINAELNLRRQERAHVVHGKLNALLAGLLSCSRCKRPMIATYTAKGGRRYRYYVRKSARQNGWASCPTNRLS